MHGPSTMTEGTSAGREDYVLAAKASARLGGPNFFSNFVCAELCILEGKTGVVMLLIISFDVVVAR
jgi:hypothetical protein